MPTIYNIRIDGLLDSRWSDWLEGMSITHENGVTLLAGPLADQCALHGLLARIRDLNLTLLSVNFIGTEDCEKEGQNE